MRLLFFRFNTQPPEGGWGLRPKDAVKMHGFNTQPPEGGWNGHFDVHNMRPSFNTQPPEGGWVNQVAGIADGFMFQHTAARRRLGFGV